MSLLNNQLEIGLLHSTLPVYRNRLAYALDGVEKMLAECGRAYVSLSFGKQSNVVAHMVWRLRPQTPMFFLASSESYLMHNFVETIDKYLTRFPVDLTIVQTNRLRLDIAEPILKLSQIQPGIKWIFRGWDTNVTDWEEARRAGHSDIQEMVDRNDYDGWFWGLAKDESNARRLTLSRKWEGQPHPTIFRYTDGKLRCCPVANWKWQDLAAYIATHNIPLLDTYHRDGLEARTTARMTGMTALLGGAVDMRRYDSAAFNELRGRFPEIQSYT